MREVNVVKYSQGAGRTNAAIPHIFCVFYFAYIQLYPTIRWLFSHHSTFTAGQAISREGGGLFIRLLVDWPILMVSLDLASCCVFLAARSREVWRGLDIFCVLCILVQGLVYSLTRQLAFFTGNGTMFTEIDHKWDEKRGADC
ncbi:hypothetical protein BDD12DRAFT_369209 [Trichophaea hybrida]|nr:hypothetical protein BDD12DRAFT_369209 [Trichophaea hybrida]